MSKEITPIQREKKLLKILLKSFYSEQLKSMSTLLIITVVMMVILLLMNGFKLDISFLMFPAIIILFLLLFYWKPIINKIRGRRAINKGNYDTKYITVKKIIQVKKNFFSKMGSNNMQNYYLIDEHNEQFEVCCVSSSIQYKTFYEFVADRSWYILYLKNIKVILTIFLNNSQAKKSEQKKFDQEAFEMAKKVFGTFGKKGN
jgi:hypothetical protein